MKTFLKILFFPINPVRPVLTPYNHLPESVYSDAAQRWPEFVTPGQNGLTVKAEIGSEKYRDVIRFLESHGKFGRMGLYPSCDSNDYSKYPITGTREFSAEDLDNARFLGVIPRAKISENANYAPDGGYSVVSSSILRPPFGGGDVTVYDSICTDTTKRKLEKEAFRGLTFKPVLITGKRPPKEPLWQLCAEQFLPPMKNRLTCEDGTEPVPGEPKRFVADDPFFPPLYRYDAASVAALGDLDAVMTKEALGWGRGEHPLFVSQRFRRWCDAQKFKIDWLPIALE